MMTNDDIIRMALEAGYQHADAVGTCEDFAYFSLERFAALVAAAEREACAKVCEEDAFVEQWKGLAEAAKRIRARGQE